MLTKLKRPFTGELSQDNIHSSLHSLEKACAALFLEVSNVDYSQDDSELLEIKKLLRQRFHLSDKELISIVDMMNNDEATSMHPFTSMVNEHYDYSARLTLLGHLWKVAYADGELSKYEEHAIRKISDLMHIRHPDYVKVKIDNTPTK